MARRKNIQDIEPIETIQEYFARLFPFIKLAEPTAAPETESETAAVVEKKAKKPALRKKGRPAKANQKRSQD